MASRNELLIIRAARAGQAAAQLALGRRYLFGGNGLPRSPTTALYWLDRAASQQEPDAWMLIGRHVPFEVARQVAPSGSLCTWYERAFDSGMPQAGLVYARLVLQQPRQNCPPPVRHKAITALETAARAGIVEAQWLLAQQMGELKPDAPIRDARQLQWVSCAANGGVTPAQYAMTAHAWAGGDSKAFLHWALPLARALLRKVEITDFSARQLPAEAVLLLSRCGQVLMDAGDTPSAAQAGELECFLEVAALARERYAQYRLGLWFAKIDAHGRRQAHLPGPAHYKKAIRWLAMAGEQGLPAAWYALSRIYLKPECSQRSLTEAQRYLHKAASVGHASAQYELGMLTWRHRKDHPANDIGAAHWLQKAAAQAHPEALLQLKKVAVSAAPAAWAVTALQAMPREVAKQHPFLAARMELAAHFGLSRAEALLVDVNAADCGHCLVIDVRRQRPRSKRRLILVQTGEQRQLLDRLLRQFEQVDCGLAGPEGSYRQRLYRLNTLC